MHWHLPKEFGKMIEFDFQGKMYRVPPGDQIYVDDSVDFAIEGRGLPLKKGPLNGAGVIQGVPLAGGGATQAQQQGGQAFKTLETDDSIMAHDDGPPIEGLADSGPEEQHVDPMVGANPLAAFDQKRSEQNQQEEQRLARGRRGQQQNPQGQQLRGAQQQADQEQKAQHEQHHGKKHE